MFIVPGAISATGTGVGMGSVSESVGVTAINTGLGSVREIGVGVGVGAGVGVTTGLTSDTSVIDIADGNADLGTSGTACGEADQGSGVGVAPRSAGGGNVGLKVGVTDPDAKLLAIDNALNKLQEAMIIRRTMIHLRRVI